MNVWSRHRRVGSWRPRPISVAAAVLVAGLPLVTALSQANAADRPAVFASRSYAAAIHLLGNPVPPPFVSELGRADFPQGLSSWDASGAANALASTYYPGVAVTGGPALVCSFAPICPPGFPPPFPTVASAQYPTSPDASASTSQDIAGPGGLFAVEATNALAHAGLDNASTEATNARLRVPGTDSSAAAVLAFRRQAALILRGPGAASAVEAQSTDSDLINVDTLSATTRQFFDADGALISRAESVLQGVHLLGGTVGIDAIRTTSIARVDPTTELAENHSQTIVSNVTVSGQSATLDEHGITVAGGSPAADEVAGALNDAFEQLLGATNTQVRLLSTSEHVDNDSAGVLSQGQADGVVVASSMSDNRVPGPVNAVATTVQLGQAASAASASTRAPSGVEIGDLPPAISDDLLSPAGPVVLGTWSPATPVGTGSTSTAGEQHDDTAQGVLDSLTGQRVVATDGPLAERVKTIYLVMTLSCLGLALGSHSWPGRRRARQLRTP